MSSPAIDSPFRFWTLTVALLMLLAGAECVGAADLTNSIPSGPRIEPTNAESIQRNDALNDSQDRLESSYFKAPTVPPGLQTNLAAMQHKLEFARQQRITRQFKEAIPNFVSVLQSDVPDTMKRTALLELALIAQDENDLPKAEQILAQYLNRWSNDPSVPEVILRQGIILRQMGLNGLALNKFYAVGTSSLVLKNDQAEYYQRLVLQAHTEIAETHYLAGNNVEAADFLTRLLKQDSPTLNKAQIEYKLIRSLSVLNRDQEVVARSIDFLSHHGDAVEQPEVRFFLATALKRLGRNGDALEQVLLLLQEQQAQAKEHPQLWAYWQQRTGNEIGNQLYREGDFTRALQVYLSLTQLDSSPVWQVPVLYQIGMSYEHLDQPGKAIETYSKILSQQAELGTNATPGLKAVLDMARWRHDLLGWQSQAEKTTREYQLQPQPSAASAPSKKQTDTTAP